MALASRLPGAAPQHAMAILSLMGGRRFCSAVVSGAPRTAIAFFQEIAKAKRYNAPIGEFATNVSAEAIANGQSLLYQEHAGYNSGALGYWKPFSAALYGNYELVEGMAAYNGSPLDVAYLVKPDWNASHLKAYTSVALITFKAYLATEDRTGRPRSIVRAIQIVKNTASRFVFFGQIEEKGFYQDDRFQKLDEAVGFVENLVEALNSVVPLPQPNFKKISKNGWEHDLYDEIASLAYELIVAASSVKRPGDLVWGVQHNTVWGRFFSFGTNNDAWRIVQYKIQRLIYKEISDKSFSYLTSRVLGMVLNVAGFRRTMGSNEPDELIRRYAILWTKKNLMKQWQISEDVVESGLPENLQLYPQLRRLTRTYPRALSRKPKVVYIQLD